MRRKCVYDLVERDKANNRYRRNALAASVREKVDRLATECVHDNERVVDNDSRSTVSVCK